MSELFVCGYMPPLKVRAGLSFVMSVFKKKVYRFVFNILKKE